MSVPNDDVMPSSSSQIISEVFSDLLDSIIVDVASECHRIARLGLDSNLEEEEEELRLSAEARAKGSDPSNSGDTNGKYVVDIFGQTHPSIAAEVFECMNCGQSIAAGRFAPHLEKCMGKYGFAPNHIYIHVSQAQLFWERGFDVIGVLLTSMQEGRKARRKVTRSTSAAAQTRQTRASTTASSYSPNPNPTTRSTTVSRIPNGNSGGVAGGEEYSSGMTEDF